MNSRIFKDSKLFIAIVFSSISFLGIQPFDDLTRGILYGIILAYSVIFLICNIKTLKFKNNLLLIIAFAFYIYSSVILTAHGDFMDIGFAHLQVFIITLCASIDDNVPIEDTLIFLCKTLTVLSLIMGIGSLLLEYIPNEYIPQITAFSSKLGKLMYYNEFAPRIPGLGLNPNITAGFVTLGFIASLHLFFVLEKSKTWTILSFTNGVIAAFIIVLCCASRTCMLTLGLFTLAYPLARIIMHKNTNRDKLILIILVVALIVCIAILVMNKDIRDTVFLQIIRISTLSTGAYRSILWQEFLDAFAAHKMLGIPRHSLSFESCHNIFIDVLTFTGIIGLIFYLLHMLGGTLVLFRETYRNRKTENCTTYLFYSVCMVIIMIQAITEYFIFLRYNIFGLFSAYILGISIRCYAKNTAINSKEIL